MFGISEGELVIILVFGFLLFGPDKLPQMGHTIGRALRQFRETQEKMTAVVQTEIIDPVTEVANAPLKPKKATVDTDEDIDTDADADTTEAAPTKKETFAERRARLAAEKAAQEEAAQGEGEESGSEDAAEASTSEDAAADVAEAAEASVPVEPEKPAAPTIEDLYARRPRKRKKQVVQDLAAEFEAAEAEAEAEPEPAATEVPATEAAPVEGGEA